MRYYAGLVQKCFFLLTMLLFLHASEKQKKAPASRALRVRLCVVVTAERAETRPARQRGLDIRRVFIVRNPDARPRDKGNKYYHNSFHEYGNEASL